MIQRPWTQQQREKCRALYSAHESLAAISKREDIPERTLFRWRNKYQWQRDTQTDVDVLIAQRINALALRENKTASELQEFEMLCEKLTLFKLKMAELEFKKINALAGLMPAKPHKVTALQALEEPDQPVSTDEKPQKKKTKKAKPPKNDISGISEAMILMVLDTIFYAYQRLWWAAKNNPKFRRNRFILKSRQIGATYYFAFEALADAILTGDNQIFLSASRDQAEVFKAYIIAFAFEHFDTELKGAGSVIKLSNGAELRFLSTNSRTAQSYHGHLYVDECFWIPDFNKMWKVASGMSAHKKWRRTLFSTPSAMSHQAYAMWSGEKFNEHKAEAERVEFAISHEALSQGVLGADKIWRHMVTMVDAERQGCDLFDIDELKTEYSADDFANLFMCKFIDDAKSVFSWAIMMTCYAQTDLNDYKVGAARPYGNKPVAIGYDPSRTRDNASLSILAIPLKPTDKWRVLHTVDFHGQNFQYQANRIKDIVDAHNVQHIGIDTTGIGYGLFELVQNFYKRTTPINYSNDMKIQLVMKAIDVIENGRFEYDGGHKQITQSFMMISKTTTTSGGGITYSSNRTYTNGHADVAWSIMHALHYEPISPRIKSTVTLSD